MHFHQALSHLSEHVEPPVTLNESLPRGLDSILRSLSQHTGADRKRDYTAVLSFPDTGQSFEAPLPTAGYPAEAFQELKAYLVQRQQGFWVAVHNDKLQNTSNLSAKFYGLSCPGTKGLTDLGKVLAIYFKGDHWVEARSYDHTLQKNDEQLPAILVTHVGDRWGMETELSAPQFAERIKQLPEYATRKGHLIETVDQEPIHTIVEEGNGKTWSTHVLKKLVLASGEWTASGTLDNGGGCSILGIQWSGEHFRAGKHYRMHFKGEAPQKVYIFPSGGDKAIAEEIIDLEANTQTVNLSLSQCFEALESHPAYLLRSEEDPVQITTREGEFSYRPSHHASIIYEAAAAELLRNHAHVIYEFTSSGKRHSLFHVDMLDTDWMAGKKVRAEVEFGKVTSLTVFSSIDPDKIFIRYRPGTTPTGIESDLSLGGFLEEGGEYLPSSESSVSIALGDQQYTIPDRTFPNNHLTLLLNKLLRSFPGFEMHATKRSQEQKSFAGFVYRKAPVRNAPAGSAFTFVINKGEIVSVSTRA